ncbi:MAG: DEAD/DEAH box helicase [Rhodothermaceae bacterium]
MINKIFDKIGAIFRKNDRPVKKRPEKKEERIPTLEEILSLDSDQALEGNKKPKPEKVKEKTNKPAARPEKTNRKKQQPVTENKQESKPKPKKVEWTIDQYQVPEKEGETRFHDINLPGSLMHAIADLGFKYCTPIQAQLLPKVLRGKDGIGQAQTGTGKTATFLLNIFSHIIRRKISKRKAGYPRALILAPTRELVMQIEKDARELLKYNPQIKILSIFGGMDYKKQKNKLNSQVVDVIVATPGRLIDFKKNGDVHLSSVEILVIDEADRMLDMGFIPDVRSIVKSTPFKDKRQTLFFSATMSGDVERLSNSWTKESVRVLIKPENVAAETVDQKIYIVTTEEKYALLYNTIKKNKLERVIVFCNRRDEAKLVFEKLYGNGIEALQLSGDIDQKERVKTLEDFKSGKINVLVATDVAGRGIHIDSVSHVINYSLPSNPEDYVHRIGRTGRAGASGISVGFACEEDSFNIPAIEEYLKAKLDCDHPDDSLLEEPPAPVRKAEEKKPAKKNYKSRNNNNRRHYGQRKNYKKTSSSDNKKNDGKKPAPKGKPNNQKKDEKGKPAGKPRPKRTGNRPSGKPKSNPNKPVKSENKEKQ